METEQEERPDLAGSWEMRFVGGDWKEREMSLCFVGKAVWIGVRYVRDDPSGEMSVSSARLRQPQL